MLDIGGLVDAEEAQRLLVRDPVALDQALDLGCGDPRELAFIGVERAQAGRVGLARELAKRVDQALRFGIERLAAHARFALTEAAGEHQPQGRVILLAGFDSLFFGEVLGQHPPAVAVRTGAVHRAHGARKSFDMVEILAGVSTKRVQRQPAFGPRLVKGMRQHRLALRPSHRLPWKP